MTKKHIGTFETCPSCLRYIRLGDELDDPKGYASTTRRLHRAAINRRIMDQVYTDLGMVKVRGALGGTYYE
ncbi:hypothetical protein LCGC14_2786250 [marine sediment metagenome]|uniref:Uncharacterized protein n=1 Tax=marine sediment metagenome TaxID=412755 RepID=A0A0F8ZDX4_9ZZZZ